MKKMARGEWMEKTLHGTSHYSFKCDEPHGSIAMNNISARLLLHFSKKKKIKFLQGIVIEVDFRVLHANLNVATLGDAANVFVRRVFLSK